MFYYIFIYSIIYMYIYIGYIYRVYIERVYIYMYTGGRKHTKVVVLEHSLYVSVM